MENVSQEKFEQVYFYVLIFVDRHKMADDRRKWKRQCRSFVALMFVRIRDLSMA